MVKTIKRGISIKIELAKENMFRDKIKTIEPENAEFVKKMGLDGKEWRQCVRTVYEKLFVFAENDKTLKICLKTENLSIMKRAGKSRFYFAT